MAESSVVFLMYHELELPGRALCHAEPGYVRYVLRASTFREQMEILKSKGWRGTSVGEAVGQFSKNTAAITFDDGCETDLLAAAPVLREFGFGATFFITSGWLGRRAFLSASQLRELASRGFEIGSHSMTHTYLTDLDDTALRHEIAGSKLELEQILGQPIEHFSCPGGSYDARVAQFVREVGYRTVSTSQVRANTSRTDTLALGRIAVLRNTSATEFWNVCQARGLWRAKLSAELRDAVRNTLGNAAYNRLRKTMLRISSNDSST
jgi:peptidoglycan/xylan/chitin deacetylase (PgdA/CDA1 family)